MKVPKGVYQRIALERMKILFNLAKNNAITNPERTSRYIGLAQDISKKSNVPIPTDIRRQFCKKCLTFFIFGKNSKVRLDSKTKTRQIICGTCKAVQRIPYSQKPAKKDKPDKKSKKSS